MSGLCFGTGATSSSVSRQARSGCQCPLARERLVVERMDDDRHIDARSFDFDVADRASLTRIIIQTGAGIPLAMARVTLGAGARLKQFVVGQRREARAP